MTLTSTGFGSSRLRRVPSLGSNSSPSRVLGSSDSQDNASSAPSDANYGPVPNPVHIPSTTSNPREPTRSSVHLSYQGPLAPVDTAQYARSVREDTAELASYVLSDRVSTQSTSPPQRTAHTNLESFFASGSDSEWATNREAEAIRQAPIPELSEPSSPERGPGSDKSRGTSVISNMLRRSPPSTSPPENRPENGAGEDTRRKVVERERESRPCQGRLTITPNGVQNDERTPLMKTDYVEHQRPDYIHGEQDLERQGNKRRESWPKLRNVVLWPKEKAWPFARNILNPKTWDRRVIWREAVVAPVGYLPAVILGLLLNILDALSYGMILFPLGQPIFEKLGSAGISMFYISCIVSQLVYSLGGSRFRGGIGSEMIEVVPFFHKMAFTIMNKVGEDNPKAVIATTITSYAISSVLTGLVFFLMGVFRFGYIVGFIPRHILTGCIGGVGWFLIATGFEVTARLDGNLNYNGATLRKMFDPETLTLWIIPFILSIVLYRLQQRIKSKYLLPAYILTIPAIFYFFVFSLDELDLENLTQAGWIFEGPESGEPWWYFYTLYDFKVVHWGAIAECIPAMFALTFFGILHVPINVPSLAFSVKEDNLNLDRELIAHGLSNGLSGLVGSIQNYLVYANSVLFYRSGGDSRVAGVMLAILTVGVLVIGPVIIGLIPIMMVGVLIFDLGFELFLEAIWEPRKKLKLLEYLTVVAIVLVMGMYDFVAGIFLGIMLAFVSLVVYTSRVPAIRASYSGEVARSTVRRNPIQTTYIRKVGEQIHLVKLAGFLFFGTIVSVEEQILALIDDEAFHSNPIRFLVLDLCHVTGIDYSAAEAFNRLHRIFSAKSVTVVMSGVKPNGPLESTLIAVGLGQDGKGVRMVEELNSALESCENELLKTLYLSKDARSVHQTPAHLDVPERTGRRNPLLTDVQFNSPRRSQLVRVATSTLNESPGEARYQNFKQPLPLILQTFHGLTDKNEDFWFSVVPYFTKKEYARGEVLYNSGDPATSFYLLEEGMLCAEYDLPQGHYFESITAGTSCGELPFFSGTERTAKVAAERDCMAWLLDQENWEKLQQAEPEIVKELLQISLKLTTERMDAITSYVLISAG